MKKVYTFIVAALLHFCFAGYAQEKRLAFIENKNQWNAAVKYKADLPGGAVFLTDAGFTYSFYSTEDISNTHEQMHDNRGFEAAGKTVIRGHAYAVRFLNANPDGIRYATQDKRSEYYNFFTDRNPAKWAGKVAAYETIIQHNVYNGIDMKVYSRGSDMKYDFIVSPGADPSAIILNFEGVSPELTEKGNLRIKTSVNEITEGKPVCYQLNNGIKEAVKSRYRQFANRNVVFEFPDGYDKNNVLIIDPSLVFSTFSGGTSETFGMCAGYDQNGALFSGGQVRDVGWPVTLGAFQQTFSGINEIGINKYAPDGSTLIYSTYYGGSVGELPIDMNINSNNELILMGITASADFPLTPGAYDNTYNGALDFFVARFSEDGASLLGATYVGGTGAEAPDVNHSQVEVDANGNMIVIGNTESPDFPVSITAAQPVFGGIQDGVIFKVNQDCSQLLYATFLGGATRDMCMGITLDNQGDMVVCGRTNSQNFPVTAGAMLTSYQGGDDDGFVAIINSATGALSASTYVGSGTSDYALRVQVDANQNIVVMGQTWGLGNYPVSPGTFNVAGGDVFLHRIQPDLSASIQSTRVGAPAGGPNGGGGTTFSPTAFRYSGCNNTLIAGQGVMLGMPVTNDAYNAASTEGFYFCVLDDGWQNLLYGSYFPSNAHYIHSFNARFDPQGNLYHAVCTDATGFTTTAGVFAPNKLAAGYDNAAFKFDLSTSGTLPVFSLNDTFLCNDAPFSITASVADTIPPVTYQWGPAAAIMTAPDLPTVIVNPAVSTTITLVVSNNCGSSSDTVHIEISDAGSLSIYPGDTTICPGDTIMLVASGDGNITWDVTSNMAVNNRVATVWPDQNTIYSVKATDSNNCDNEATATVRIAAIPELDAGSDIYLAYGEATNLNGTASGNFFWEYDVSNPYILRPEVKPLQTTTYYLTVAGSEGCTAIDSMTVFVISTGLPNAFSPNGDGLNDVFIPVISNGKGYIPLDFSIYNRWGQRIFYSINPELGWNGTYNDKPADMGTYYYYIRYSIGNKEFIKKGDVTLMR